MREKSQSFHSAQYFLNCLIFWERRWLKFLLMIMELKKAFASWLFQLQARIRSLTALEMKAMLMLGSAYFAENLNVFLWIIFNPGLCFASKHQRHIVIGLNANNTKTACVSFSASMPLLFVLTEIALNLRKKFLPSCYLKWWLNIIKALFLSMMPNHVNP